jgi:CCR4-NOT complex subunit CAF16
LDVLVRDDLIRFLKADSEARNATIVCKFFSYILAIIFRSTIFPDATHIFDGLNDFPTHIAHMRFGAFVTPPIPWPTPKSISISKNDVQVCTPLYRMSLDWLREDREYRHELEKQGKKRRGARADVSLCLGFSQVQNSDFGV